MLSLCFIHIFDLIICWCSCQRCLVFSSRLFSFKSISRLYKPKPKISENRNKVFPGKPELFTEDCKALNPNISRYWNQGMVCVHPIQSFSIPMFNKYFHIEESLLKQICPVFWGAFHCDGQEQYGAQVFQKMLSQMDLALWCYKWDKITRRNEVEIT